MMDKFGIKATLYDLLGYVVPGAILITGCWFILLDEGSKNFAFLGAVSFSWPFAILLLGGMYATGHIIASLSSLILENSIMAKSFAKVYKIPGASYDSRTRDLFGCDYKDVPDRVIVGYCQSTSPIIYDTAFVFLSIYGFSRNAGMSILLVLIFAMSATEISITTGGIGVVSLILLLHNYLRFKKYFAMQIASSLMVRSPIEQSSGKVPI